MPRLLTGVCFAGSDLLLLARVLGVNGLPITPASISTIAWVLTDLTLGVAVSTGTFAVAGTVLTQLVQGDPRWTFDTPAAPGPDGLSGYNLIATLPAANIPPVAPGGSSDRLQLDLHFTDTSGGSFRVVWQFVPVPVYG